MTYLHFNFNGISSENYNLIVQNKGEDLSYPSQPVFENQVVSPLYQGTSYLAGVNKKDRTFNFSCWADSLTLNQTKEMLNWLSVYKVGKLSLDYNPDFFYNVKIASISDFKHLPINADGTINYEFSISFTTLEEFAAQSNTLYNSVLNFAPNGLPCGMVDGDDIYFYNTYSLPLYLNFNIVSISGITINKNDITYYSYPVTGTYTLNSKYGFCLNNDGKLIEEVNPSLTFTNLGPLEINSNLRTLAAKAIDGELVFDIATITPTTLFFTNSNLTLYNTLSYNSIIEDLNLNENDTVVLNCFEPIKINLSSGITYSFRFRDNF